MIQQTGNIRDPQTGVLLTAQAAVERGLISSDIADRLSQADISTQSTKLTRGYYGAGDYQSTDLQKLSLYETVLKGLYDEQSGNIIEPVSRTLLSVQEAVRRQIIDQNQREVYDQKSREIISLSDAVNRGIIDCRSGKFNDSSSGKQITFGEAVP